MDIKHGILTKAYDTDCAYKKLIIPDRTTIIGKSSCTELDITEAAIPASITKIEDFAFFKSNIEEIIIPDNVNYIGQRTFAECHNLKRVTLPKNLKYLGPSAFSGCSNLEEIILPSGLEEINYRTFAECRRLKKVIIPDGVKKIDWAVFAGCDILEEIELPDSITSLNKQLFANCKRLKRIKLPKNIEMLPDEFFKNCESLDIELDPSIIVLGSSVFEGCTSLTHFPSNVFKFGSKCFKYCHKLTSVKLNDEVNELPEGMFDDCTNLSEIIYEGKNKLFVGARCFRNCISLTEIPSFIIIEAPLYVKNYAEGLFEGCLGLTEVDLSTSSVPTACFRNCKNLRVVNNSRNVQKLGSDAFSGCEALESIDLRGLRIIPSGALRNCTSLKKVDLGKNLTSIGKEAFYYCINLEDFDLPDSVERIDKRALKHCHSIKCLVIPGMLKRVHDDSLSHMYSLERIEVSPTNKRFMTPDNLSLISEQFQKFILYAGGSKNKSYSLANYCIGTYEGSELIRPINIIGPYAFAGAKNLEELTICTCVNDIERTAFDGCDNLKKLIVQNLSLFGCQGFKIRDKGKYYFREFSDEDIFIPFETVEYSEDLTAIMQDALPYFDKVTKVIFPSIGTFQIFNEAFKGCPELKDATIPTNVKAVGQNAFPKGATLRFSNGLVLTGLVEQIYNNDYKGEYKLYILDDGTYYIEEGDILTKIKKQEIDEAVSHSEQIRENPILFLDFFNDLYEHDLGNKIFLNGILMANMSLENREIFYGCVKPTDERAIDIIDKSTLLDKKDAVTDFLLADTNFTRVKFAINLLKKYDVRDQELYHKYFMRFTNFEVYESLLNLDRDYLIYVIKYSKILECENKDLITDIFASNRIEQFINLLKKYNVKSRILLNPIFIALADNPLFEKLLSVFDANIKRVIVESNILNNQETGKQNLLDLLNLLEITGALESDKIIRQRASTFITEKMFHDKLPNGENNRHRVIGDDIHRVFNFRLLREEFDLEFANFYLENYQELIENERKKAGFIERVYINFREISRTCTSDKGSQRKLKVTLEKCINYLSNVKFDGINQSNQELANLISAWYDENKTWIDAQVVYKEAQKAPRNIFTEIKYDEKGEVIYDMNPENDLREEISEEFSYEWLPKQDMQNLVLGKYCNCCAHIAGAGQGIMRASMIHDSVQNLVIRNPFGDIIAKSTLYVNRSEGYAVFNNVESSVNHRADDEKEKIYNAFMRGAKAFVETYNKNNNIKLSEVTIGATRNTVLEHLTDEKHPKSSIHQSLEFGQYSFGGYAYAGDWKSEQRLVLKI